MTLASFDRAMRHGLLVLAGGLVLACGDPATETNDDVEPTWGGTLTDDQVGAIGPDGRTARVRMSLGQGAGVVALHVSPADPEDGAAYCFQLENVSDARGSRLVAAADDQREWGRTCHDCSQRVSVGHGFGWFVFPNDGAEFSPGGHLDAVVAIRDCATLLPAEPQMGDALPQAVRIRALVFEPPPPSPLALRLFVAHTADSGVDDVGALTWVEALVAAANARHVTAATPSFALTGSARLASVEGPVRFADGEQAGLDELYREARLQAAARAPDVDRLAIVILVGCLERVAPDGTVSEVQGFAPRIPGGGSTGTFADGVFVSTGRCHANGAPPGPSAESRAKVLAHELGHFLGLYHTVEASGDEDLLPDTDAHNLMSYRPDALESAGLSPCQARVMARHPYVVVR